MAPTTRGRTKRDFKSAEIINEEEDFVVTDDASDAGNDEYNDDEHVSDFKLSDMDIIESQEEEEEEEEEAKESEIEEPPKTPSRKRKPITSLSITPSPTKTPRRGIKRSQASITGSDSDNPFVPSDNQDSPTKKTRFAPSPRNKLPPTPAALKTPKSALKPAKTSKGKSPKKPSPNLSENVGSESDDGQVSPSPLSTNSKAKDDNNALEDVTIDSDAKFDDKKEAAVLLEDLTRDPIATLKHCGVNDAAIMDKLLKNTYGPSLPKLPSGKHLMSWKKQTEGDKEASNPPGMAKLTLIMREYPKLDLKYMKQLITFNYDPTHNVVNLSRVDPALIISKKFGKSDMVYIRDRKKPALCISVAVIEDDHTASPKNIGENSIMKFVTATPLTQEYERLVAVLCMTHGVEMARCPFPLL